MGVCWRWAALHAATNTLFHALAVTLFCSCKFAHPFDQAPKVLFNSLGLPLRPTEPECSFFMKNFR
jgi:hypothetical protein